MGAGFLDEDLLLPTATARRLYHEVAATLPIVDVHNHLPPADLAGNRTWETLTDLWLADDHYKWRAMRVAGVPEHLVTGPADPWERFEAWAATVPQLLGNPLHTWTHLELRRVFDIDQPLGPATAHEIWEEANAQLPRWPALALLRHFAVTLVATTDGPPDDLQHHRSHRELAGPDEVVMIPTFRPDPAHAWLGEPERWNGWVDALEASEDVAIGDLESLLGALASSYRRFDELGCRASDHGLARLPDADRNPVAADGIVRRARQGRAASPAEREVVLLEVVTQAARLAHEHDAVLQLHLGPRRDVSPRLLRAWGHDAGADVMGDDQQVPGLARLLGDLEGEGTLPRTVLYNLNPADNLAFATLAGAFSRPGVRSLVQWGPPWWFNDHDEGMRRQLEDLSHVGALGTFIGMLTDSRSVLSMTRHELFRRVLCGYVGDLVESGRAPADPDALDALTRAACLTNVVEHFGLAR